MGFNLEYFFYELIDFVENTENTYEDLLSFIKDQQSFARICGLIPLEDLEGDQE